METKVDYVVVEQEAGVRRLNLRAVVEGKHQDNPQNRVAFLAGAYVVADSLGLDTLPAGLFRSEQGGVWLDPVS